MSKLRKQVGEFHALNDQPILHKPQVPADDRVRLRLALIAEEFFEALTACGVNFGAAAFDVREGIEDWGTKANLPELADALADLDYVIEGTRLEFGIDGGPIAAEVHRSNMSKLGADGKPIKNEIGKVVKGPNFTPPDIAGELRKQGWEG